MKKILSIVVPTKNRYEYLKFFIRIIESFEKEDIELVVQDNSDDNTEFLTYLSQKNYKFLVYNYEKESLSIIENSDRAIKNATGKYVCFMGDDDLVAKQIYDFVCMMDKQQYESAYFERGHYYWPGVGYKAHKFPNLLLPTFKGKIKFVDTKNELIRLLRYGATSLGNMPQLYHGVILKEKLEEIYSLAGTYFPGPSPDMAVAVALSKVISSHIVCDIPITISGTAPKSAGGLGAKHEHKGELNKATWLPKDTEEKWEKKIPKVWTGPTIYAESAIKAMQRVDIEKTIVEKMNYIYLYAYMWIFCPDYKQLVKEALGGEPNRLVKFNFYIIGIWIKRVINYLNNIRIVKLKMTRMLQKENITNSLCAFNIVNEVIQEKIIDFNKMEIKDER